MENTRFESYQTKKSDIYVCHSTEDLESIQKELKYILPSDYMEDNDSREEKAELSMASLVIAFISNKSSGDEAFLQTMENVRESGKPVLRVVLEDIDSETVSLLINSTFTVKKYELAEAQYCKILKSVINEYTCFHLGDDDWDVRDYLNRGTLCDIFDDWAFDISYSVCKKNEVITTNIEKHSTSYSKEIEKVERKRSVIKDILLPVAILFLLIGISASIFFVNYSFNYHYFYLDDQYIIMLAAIKGIRIMIGLCILWFTIRYSKYAYRISQLSWLIICYGMITGLFFLNILRLSDLDQVLSWNGICFVFIFSFLMYFSKMVVSIDDEVNKNKFYSIVILLLNIGLISVILVITNSIVLVILLHLTIIVFCLYTRRYYLLFSLLFLEGIFLLLMMFSYSYESRFSYEYRRIADFFEFRRLSNTYDFAYQEMNAFQMIKNNDFWGSLITGNFKTFYIPEAMEGYTFSIFNYIYGVIGVIITGIMIVWFGNKIIHRTSRTSCVLESDIRGIFSILVAIITIVGMMTSVGFLPPNNIGVPMFSSNSVWIYLVFVAYGLLENNRSEEVSINVNRSLFIQLCAFAFGWFVIGYVYHMIV